MTIFAPTSTTADGYGQVTQTIAEELNRLNYTPNIALLMGAVNDPTIARVHFTMWESTKLFNVMVALLNTRELIIVPNKQDRIDFILNGVTAPIEVCPLYCRGSFKPFPAPEPFHFLCVGAEHTIPDRKRHHDLVAAFQYAFPTEANVRLTIKRTPRCSPLPCFDLRIRIITDRQTPEQMADLYASAHVGVLPGGMESWSLPAAELAANGRASIIPLFRGPAEFLDGSCAFALPFQMAPAPKSVYHNQGEQAYAPMDGLISAMRHVYKNPFEVYQRGIAAKIRADDYSPARFGVRLRDILQNYVDQLAARQPAVPKSVGPVSTGSGSTSQVSVVDHTSIQLS